VVLKGKKLGARELLMLDQTRREAGHPRGQACFRDVTCDRYAQLRSASVKPLGSCANVSRLILVL